MARHIDQTMGKFGASLSWRDLAGDRRTSPTRPVETDIAPEFNPLRQPLDATEEDFSEPLPIQRYSDAEPSTRALIIASLLVVVVVVGLLAMTLAI